MDLLLLLFTLLPGCLCKLTVTVSTPVEVRTGERAVMECKPNTSWSSKLSASWFIDDADRSQVRIAVYTDGKSRTDPDTEYSGRVSINSDFSLVINDIRPRDERMFYCTMSSETELSDTVGAELKVYDPPEAPELTLGTSILSVTETDATEIGSCVSRNAYPAPTIQWYKNKQLLNTPTEPNNDLYMTSRTVTEASGLYTVSSTLFLRPTKQDKDARFFCKVVYPLPGGAVSHMESKDFTLTLHYYTENVNFEVTSGSLIKEGDNVTLRCVADGFPPPEYIMYRMKDGVEESLPENSDGVYTIYKVTKDYTGSYRCQVLDFDSPPEFNLIRDIELFVHYVDPLSLIPQGPVTAALGQDVILSCSGEGSEEPQLRWMKDNKVLSESSRYRLHHVSYSESGVYTCVATVSKVPGLRKEENITVIVEGPPLLDSGDERVEVPAEGVTVTLTCSAQGYPETEIIWSPPELQSSQTVTGLRVESTASVKASSKLINAISCTAKNSKGSKEKKFTLDIKSLVLPSTAPAQEQSGGSSTAIIAVVVCVLLLLLVVALFYFLQKKGKLTCGSSEKQSLAQDPASAELAVELKSEKRNEERGLLGSRGGGGQLAEC
ncbi:basal cell adhesion molecule [Rhinophrynus dorsalis]